MAWVWVYEGDSLPAMSSGLKLELTLREIREPEQCHGLNILGVVSMKEWERARLERVLQRYIQSRTAL